MRGGRFFSGIGYLNALHAHAWDFVDQPLVYRALLGNQYKDDGAQLRWVAPTDLFLEFGAEAFRGGNFPAGGAAENGKGHAGAVRTHRRRRRHRIMHGAPAFRGSRRNRRTAPPRNNSATDLFTGTSELTGVDVVWNGRRTATPGNGISSSRRNISRATKTAASTRRRPERRWPTAANRKAGTPRAYTSSCRAGASGYDSTSSRIRRRECGARRVGTR